MASYSCTYNSQVSTTVHPSTGQLEWLTGDNEYSFFGDSNSKGCTTVIKFTTPNFTCASDSITFNLVIAPNAARSLNVCYALTTDASDRSKYFGAVGDVTEASNIQLVTGKTLISLHATNWLTTVTLTMDTQGKLAANKSYYLYIWPQYTGQGLMTLQPQGEYINATSNVNHTITLTNKHSYTKTVVSPTCTTSGYDKYTCSCGDYYTNNTTAALGHIEVNGGTATVHTKCSRCGVTLSSTHSYTSSVQTAATCTEKGTTKYDCKCGYSYTSQNIKALGHAYVGVVTKEPTPTSDGIMTYTCSRCGASYTAVIPRDANGAIYIDNGTNLVTYYVYIDDGSAWKLYVPFIDNGSSWDVCM